MNVTTFKNAVIPKIKAFTGFPIIQADQIGNAPEGPHVVYKITTSHGKDRGQAEETGLALHDKFVLLRTESFRRVISFTAYAMEDDDSLELAQAVHDWFTFAGYDELSMLGIVLIEATTVQNRDAFVLEEYERRNGFDVTLRMTRETQRELDYIERIDAFDPQPDIELIQEVDVAKAFENDGAMDWEYTPDVEMDDAVTTTEQPTLMAGTGTKANQAVIL